jgi:hypothetical protein
MWNRGKQWIMKKRNYVGKKNLKKPGKCKRPKAMLRDGKRKQ